MPGTFSALHTVSRKNLSAAGAGQPRSFFFARVGAEALLYIGPADEKNQKKAVALGRILDNMGLSATRISKLKDATEKAAMKQQRAQMLRSLKGAKWMHGLVTRQNEGRKTLTFTRHEGTAKAVPAIELHLKKPLKEMALTGVKVVLQSDEQAEAPKRKRQRIDVRVQTSSDLTESTPDIPGRMTSGSRPTPGHRSGPPSGRPGPHHSHPDHTAVVGRVLGQLAPDMLSATASLVNSKEELTSDDSTTVEKVSSTVASGGSVTELIAHGIAIGERLKEKSTIDGLLSGPDKPDPSSGPPTDHSSPKDHIDRAVRVHKGTEKVLSTLDRVGEIASDITVGAGVVYSGSKAIRAGKELYDSTEQKARLRSHIRHMKVIDALQKRFAGMEDEVDIRRDPTVRALVERFREERPPVGKQAVLDTLRMLVEVKTSRQKQSGVDLVANTLKVAGGVTTLSGVGAGVGMALSLTGTGVQVGKAGVDLAVDHGRTKKHEEERSLTERLSTPISDAAQQKLAHLVETETALRTEKARIKKTKARLLALALERKKLEETLAHEDEMLALVDDVLSDLDPSDEDSGEDVSSDTDELDIDGILDELPEETRLSVLQAREAALRASLKESRARRKQLKAQHTAQEADINDTVIPELFQASQKARLDEILDGKARRRKKNDGEDLSFREELTHMTTVNEDASAEAMRARREQAVSVLMSGRIPPFLRREMIAILGIDDVGWAKLQEADAATRAEALRLLLVI